MRNLFFLIVFAALGAHAAVPDYAGPVSKAGTQGEATAVFAGGCFWGVDAVFKHVKGVTNVVSGYSGGSAATAKYMMVGTGATGHAESVKVTYDPSKVDYAELLKVFFSVAHDPIARPSSMRMHSRRNSLSVISRSSMRPRHSASPSSRRSRRSTSSTRPRIIIRITWRFIPSSRTSSTTTCRSSPS